MKRLSWLLPLLVAGCATPEVEETTPRLLEARKLYEAKDLDGAIREALAAAEEDPEAIQPRWLLSFCYEEKGDWKSAVEAIQGILAVHPEFIAGANRMGEIFVGARRTEDAASCFRRCIEADPTWVPALVNLGALAFEAGRAEEAIALLMRAVELAPDHGYARLQYANALNLAGRTDEARQQVEAAIACEDLPEPLREEARRYLATLPARESH